ncbi:MAG: diacylglycerol kinase family protein, partial [Nitriliruptoraceae bacterium]
VLAEGHRHVVAVGGDGTVHDVVNGLVDADTGRVVAEDLVLGVVSAGSGSDFARTFGLDRPPETLVRHLLSTSTMPIDLGRVAVTAPDGSRRWHVFANVAEAGFGGRVARAAGRLPRRWGAARYRWGIVASWSSFRRVDTTVTLPDAIRTERVCNVVVANGQFFGGGMHVAPRAIPDDGVFSVQSWGGTPTDVVRAARQLRTGAHLQRTDVRSWSTAIVEVDAVRPLVVEADGEVLGTTPARFEILPRVLDLGL